jgi:hypothetical protein
MVRSGLITWDMPFELEERFGWETESDEFDDLTR